jgi:selenocysteine-specific elongation factor
MRVIGTAGHVDHGKSTLIAALTGIHPDRLKEEKEREMTIDLGFAWLTTPGGEEIGFVDVPGHRDFIENMLAGVGGIDATLLVISADEGVMPQTREHLAILDLLQIRNGIIVLTKIDLVDDPAWLDLVEEDTRVLVRGTVLQDAPILRVSSRTRAGFPNLVSALDLLVQRTTARPDLNRPRLPVDRVFSIVGFGTVVTGTLTDGHLSVGDEIEIMPSGLRGRIRGLQTHKKKEVTAISGSRTAINITAVDVDQIHRGEVVTHPDTYQATRRIDVFFHLLADASAPLHHHDEAKLFIGTSESVVDVRLLGTEVINPGDSGWLQLDLHEPVVAVRGDRFILRRPSPGETIGGGTVMDPQPKGRHKRYDTNLIQALESIAKGSPVEVLLQAALAVGPALSKDVITRSQLDQDIGETSLQELISSGQLILLEDVVIPLSQWVATQDSLVGAISTYHQTYPLRHGIPREELKSRLKLSPHIFNLFIHRMATEGMLTETPNWIALPGHRVSFTPPQLEKVDKLLAQFTTSPISAPSVKECQVEVGEDVFSALVELGELVAVSDDVVFRKNDYELMVNQIIQIIIQKEKVTLAEVRDLLNTSRRYAQAILEYMDASGLTTREGDFRRYKLNVM